MLSKLQSKIGRKGLLFLMVVVTIMIAFTLAGCSSSDGADAASEDTSTETAATEDAPKKKIIFVTHDLNPFFIPAIIGLKDFGEMAGWETEFIGPPENDAQKTVEMQYNALSAQPDAVGFTAIDSEAYIDTIKQAQEAGIPVVIFNTRAPGVKEQTGVAYVGQDFVAAGHVAGYELGKYITEHTGRTEGLVIQPIIAPGHFALETRNSAGAEGLQMYNEEFGTNFTTEALATSINADEAIADFEAKWAAEGDNIVGWLAADFTHTFVGDWAKKNDLVGQFAVGGYDLLDQTMTNIQDGSVDFSIGQNPYGQGFLSAALLFQEMERGYAASDIDTGAELIDKSNIEAVIAREKLWKEAGAELGFEIETGG
jgi:ribose transport system substrate-binding protein